MLSTISQNISQALQRKNLWLKELIALIALWIVSFSLFFFTNIDIELMRPFYIDGKWPIQYHPLWSFFYHAAPIFAGIIAISSIIFIIFASVNAKFTKYRIHGVFVLLTLALGTGLTVNVILKDNWGRPRPRQIKEFGGNYQYTKPFVLNLKGEGKSFPCGHSSVGFTYLAFWFIFRKKNKLIATLSLTGALTLGTLIGIGRMAAGGHFPSDVLWSAIIPYTIAFFLYYFLINIPYREEMAETKAYTPRTFGIKQMALYVTLSSVAIFAVLLATPYKRDINYSIKEFSVNSTLPAVLNLQIQHGDIMLLFDNGQPEPLKISGNSVGFGLPRSRVRAMGKINQGTSGQTVVDYRIFKKGIFTDLETNISVWVNPDYFNQISIRQEKGMFEVKGLEDSGRIPIFYNDRLL